MISTFWLFIQRALIHIIADIYKDLLFCFVVQVTVKTVPRIFTLHLSKYTFKIIDLLIVIYYQKVTENISFILAFQNVPNFIIRHNVFIKNVKSTVSWYKF